MRSQCPQWHLVWQVCTNICVLARDTWAPPAILIPHPSTPLHPFLWSPLWPLSSSVLLRVHPHTNQSTSPSGTWWASYWNLQHQHPSRTHQTKARATDSEGSKSFLRMDPAAAVTWWSNNLKVEMEPSGRGFCNRGCHWVWCSTIDQYVILAVLSNGPWHWW